MSGLVPSWPAQVASTLNAKFGEKMGLEDQHALNGASLFVPETIGTLTTRSLTAMGARDVEDGCLVPEVSFCLNAGAQGRIDAANETMLPVAYSIMPMNSGKDYKARPVDVAQPVMAGGPVGGNQGGDYVAQPVAFDLAQITSKANRTRVEAGLPASTLNAAGQMHVAHPIAIQERATCENLNAGPGGSGIRTDGAAYTLEARTIPQTVQYGWRVRRLTPTECERLQGFPNGYTDIPYRGKNGAPDGPRYKALGNSMAVNAMRWIGRRIEMVDANHV